MVLLLWPFVHVNSHASSPEILNTLDRLASSFRSAEAALTKTTYTAVIDDKSTETGHIRVLKQGERLWLRVDFDPPNERTVFFDGRRLRIFYPKIRTVQEYDLASYSGLVERLLLLGFGSSGQELARHYKIEKATPLAAGQEKLWYLSLIPKAPDIREHLERAELWIAPDTGLPVKQKFHQGGGDYVLIEYSSLKRNPQIEVSQLQLQLPPGTKIERPQR